MTAHAGHSPGNDVADSDSGDDTCRVVLTVATAMLRLTLQDVGSELCLRAASDGISLQATHAVREITEGIADQQVSAALSVIDSMATHWGAPRRRADPNLVGIAAMRSRRPRRFGHCPQGDVQAFQQP
jgi:hypothetical protein